RKIGLSRNPMMGTPSMSATPAPTTWVPRTAKRRRETSGLCASMTYEPDQDAGAGDGDEEEHEGDRAGDQPGHERVASLPVEPPQLPDGVTAADQGQGHDRHRDDGQVVVGLDHA